MVNELAEAAGAIWSVLESAFKLFQKNGLVELGPDCLSPRTKIESQRPKIWMHCRFESIGMGVARFKISASTIGTR